MTKRAHPQALQPYLSEVAAFAQHNHINVLYPILRLGLGAVGFLTDSNRNICRLLALGLELPKDTFVDCHGFSSVSETYRKFQPTLVTFCV